tara:strand:- start:101 stop:409 length:309 start_codon:yes stop_codon:yes gene_type:complete
MKFFRAANPKFQICTLILFSVLVAGFFGYHVFYGAKSVARLEQVEHEIVLASQEHEKISAKRLELEEKVAMLRPGTMSRDFLEERARIVLGYRSKNEVMLEE